MKKLLFIFLAFTGLFLLGNAKVQAQTESNQIKVGAGLLYGDEPEAVGLQITGTYRFQQKIEFAPDVSIYFPDNDNFVDDNRRLDGYFAINLNGHYIFSAQSNYHVYALGGLNIAHANYVLRDNDTKLGINLGIGGEYHLEQFSIYGEIKYIVSDLDQVVIGAGVRVPINIH